MDTFKFICNQCLENSRRDLRNSHELYDFLNLHGISQIKVLDRFKIGYSPGKLKNDSFKKNLIIPFFNNEREIINITGYSILNHPRIQYNSFNPYGIFNQNNLKGQKEIILTNNPVDALFLIQHGFRNTTFIFGDYAQYSRFIFENKCRSIISTFVDHQNFLFNLSKRGIQIKQAGKIDYHNSKEYLNYKIPQAIPMLYTNNG